MKILFLTLVDINSIEDKNIYMDLLNVFANNGDEIYILSPMERRNNSASKLLDFENVKILKIKIGNIQKTNVIEKGISTIRIESQYMNAINKYFSDIKFDLVMYSTPPITFSRVIEYIKKRDGAKSYLLLKDIFPQNAVDLNMFSKNSLFYWYFRKKEEKLYKISDNIGCMSKANVDFVLEHNSYIPKEIVEICPNSIKPYNVDIVGKERENLRDKHNIPKDKTIFIYGGNLGKPQGIDFLIECIKMNEQNENIFILIVGSGAEYKKLEMFFKLNNIRNSKLFSALPKDEYELLANSCDVGLIFLDYRFTIPNFPSRLLSYMNAGMPILAATDLNTDVGRVIEENKFGYWCESTDVIKFNEHLLNLCNEELRINLGKNARRYLEEKYTVEHTYKIIMKHFE